MDLRDRVALVTGGTGGLGVVIARMLAEHTANVALTHFGHRDEGVEVCREVDARGRKSFLVQLDQTDPIRAPLRSVRPSTSKTLNAKSCFLARLNRSPDRPK